MADDGEGEEVAYEEEEAYPDIDDSVPYPEFDEGYDGGGAEYAGMEDSEMDGSGAAAPTSPPLLRASSSTEYTRAAAGGKAVSIPAADLHREVRARMAHLTNRYFMTPDEALVLLHQLKWRMDRIDEAWTEDADRVRAKVGMAAGGDPPLLPPGVKPTDIFFDEVSLAEFAYADADACACGHWAPKVEWRAAVQVAIANPTTAFGTRVRVATAGTLHQPTFSNRCTPPSPRCSAWRRGARRWCAPACSGSTCRPTRTPGSLTLWLATWWTLTRRCIGARRRDASALFPPMVDAAAATVHSSGMSTTPTTTPPPCRYAVLYTGGGAEDVVCRCGRAMCFRCGDEAHKPASCAEVESWRKREKDDGATVTWLNANTKECPKCRTHIQKNEGCNHMTCRKEAKGCGHQFCWICLAPWADHGGSFYSCHKPVVAKAVKTELEARAADLKVYMFYYERYLNQRDAVRAIHRLEGELSTEWGNLLAVHHGDGPTQDALTTTLADAMGVVTRGRHAAGWAYVHAFHIPADSVAYRALFEDSQARLEHHLEYLHERCVPSALRRLTSTLEHDYAAGLAAVEEWRRAVTQYAAATDKFLSNLLHAVEGGFVMSERETALVSAAAHRHFAARGGAGAAH